MDEAKIYDTLVGIESQLKRVADSFEKQQRMQEEMFSHTTKAGIHFNSSPDKDREQAVKNAEEFLNLLQGKRNFGESYRSKKD
jgi:hypothetical protein